MSNNSEYHVSAKGIIHCHSDASYDSSIPLEELCAALQASGFNFVALTEHTKNLTSERYINLVETCGELSSSSFLVIPGLEVRLDDGNEIAAIGVDKLIKETLWAPVVAQIRNLGGYAIWVHPRKRCHQNVAYYDCDAIEVLNGKVDGTTAPDLSLLRQARRARMSGKDVHVIFGPDLHSLDTLPSLWTECMVPELTRTAILQELRHGRFMNHSARIKITSHGTCCLYDFFLLLSLRCGYLTWNKLLVAVPTCIRKILIRSSRRVVQFIKPPPYSKHFSLRKK